MMKVCERCGGAIMAAGVTYGYAGPVCSCAWQQPRIEAARPTDETRAKWLGDALTEAAKLREENERLRNTLEDRNRLLDWAEAKLAEHGVTGWFDEARS